MWFFWVMALAPILIGAICLFFNRHLTWQEWLGGAAAALAMAGIFQILVSHGMTDDIETWSGYGTAAKHFAAWQEYYEYAVYRTEYYSVTVDDYSTDSKGRRYRSGSHQEMRSRQVFDHWEPTTRWHSDSYEFYTTLENHDIDQSFYSYISQKYNDNHAVPGVRVTMEHNSKMIGGDPNDYVADNRTGWIEPVIAQKHFENRVKAAPSLFSFAKVPTNINVYPWPAVRNWNVSGRVVGTAGSMISTLKWDQLNAVLGAAKKINLIVVGFPSGTSMDMAKWQEAKWVGGKKNDLVICFAGGPQKAEWVNVFGWTEANLVKHNLESIFLSNPINDDIIPKVSAEVAAHYVKKDWHKFDYITIEPPAWSYWVYIIVLVLTQGGLYAWFQLNEYDNLEFDKQIDYRGVERSFVDKLKGKWNALVGFFIKPKLQPVQAAAGVEFREPVSPAMNAALEITEREQRLGIRRVDRPIRRAPFGVSKSRKAFPRKSRPSRINSDW